jgi:membrane protein YfhO
MSREIIGIPAKELELLPRNGVSREARNRKLVETCIGLSYIFLPLIFFFGSDISGIYKNVFSAGESLTYYFPIKMISRDFSLWNDLLCTGIPAIADPQFQTFYPISLIFMNLFPVPFSYNAFILIHYSFAGFFSYLFLRASGLSRFSSYWGSIVFMFCGFFISHRRHIVMLNAGVWLPLVLYSLEKIGKTFKIKYFLLGTLGITMSILAGYPHITMLLISVTLAYAIWKVVICSELLRPWATLYAALMMTLFGFMLSAIQIFPMVEALRFSTREAISFEFFTMYSFDFQYLPMLIYPYIFGGGYSQFQLNFRSPRSEVTEFSGYIGVLALFLALLSIITLTKSKKHEWFWTILCGVSFLLILGNSTPLYRWLYEVPVFNLFRGPARNWYECDYGLAMLSAYGMESILQPNGDNAKIKKWSAVVAISCILIIGASLITSQIIRGLPATDSFYSVVKVNSAKLFVNNTDLHSVAVWLPTVFLLLTACFLILTPIFPRSNLVRALLLSCLLIDLFSFGYRHERFFLQYSKIIQPTAPISFLKNRGDPNRFRIFSTSDLQFRTLLSPDTNMLYGLHAIHGFEDVVLKDYSFLSGFNYFGITTPKQERFLLANNTLLSIMSTKFIATQDKELSNLLRSIRPFGKPVYTPIFSSNLEAVESVDIRIQVPHNIYRRMAERRSGKVEIFKNENYQERIRFARMIFPVKDLTEAKNLIWNSNSFDFRNAVAIESADIPIQNMAQGYVINSKFDRDNIRIQVRTEGKSFLVLSDQFYVGWKAIVDNVETPIYRTNGIMRGIFIQSPGIHNVEFSFVPESLRNGLIVSSTSLLILIGVTIWGAKSKRF